MWHHPFDVVVTGALAAASGSSTASKKNVPALQLAPGRSEQHDRSLGAVGVGDSVGSGVGSPVGMLVRKDVGEPVGITVGKELGTGDGAGEGTAEGFTDGK